MLFQVTSLKQHPSFMSMCCLWLRSLIRSIASGEPGQLDGIFKRHRLFEVYTSRHGALGSEAGTHASRCLGRDRLENMSRTSWPQASTGVWGRAVGSSSHVESSPSTPSTAISLSLSPSPSRSCTPVLPVPALPPGRRPLPCRPSSVSPRLAPRPLSLQARRTALTRIDLVERARPTREGMRPFASRTGLHPQPRARRLCQRQKGQHVSLRRQGA